MPKRRTIRGRARTGLGDAWWMEADDAAASQPFGYGSVGSRNPVTGDIVMDGPEWADDGGYSGPVTIDNSTGDIVEKTIDPDIVRQRMDSTGGAMPSWAMSNDGTYWYGATQAALLKGKIVAAAQTLAEIPANVAATINKTLDSLPTIGKWAIVGLVALAFIEYSGRRK